MVIFGVVIAILLGAVAAGIVALYGFSKSGFSNEPLDSLALCERNPSQGGRDGCLAGVAAETKNETLCTRITQFQNLCFSNVARAKMDSSVCALASTQDDREWCYAASVEAIPDISICENRIQSQKFKDICFMHFVYNTKNVTVCERIANPGGKDSCKDYVEKSLQLQMKRQLQNP